MKKTLTPLFLIRITTLILICYTQNQCVQAQNKVSPYSISLKSGTVSIPENAGAFRDSIVAAKPADDIQVIIQFYELPDDAQKQLLKNSGISFINYLSSKSYSAVADPSLFRNLALNNIRSIAIMDANWKLDPRVKQLIQATKGPLNLSVSFLKTIHSNEVKKLLDKHYAVITNKKFASQGVYEINIKGSEVLMLANEAYVTYVGIAAKDVSLNNDERAMAGVVAIQHTTGLDGSGMAIGVGDNCSGLFHTDTRDRVTNFNPDVPENHGQHVTATVAGKGIIDPKGEGIAPNASILNHIYNAVWAQTQPMRQDYGMTLTNNSYAAIVNDCSVAGTYDNYSQMLDDQSHDFPDVLHVFAAGNDGDKNCPPYPFGFGTVVGVYQTAKNILTVSSARKSYTEHEGASKGPVKDGRLKPEVVSFGADLYSAFLNDTYLAISGTSMASPGATGILALISQRYKQLHSNSNPPNALLKTLIINGATDLGNVGPDYINGFGLINLYRPLEMLNNNQYRSNTIANAATQTLSVNVPSNTAQLKVLLYWNDVSASPTATVTLVNNLDLTVREPNNTLHRPLILDPTPANVTNLAIEAVDNLNNVEQIVINNPQAGNHTIDIKASSIPTGMQEYYVAYDFIQRGVSLKYPTAGVAVPANETIMIFWDASDDPNTFTLEYSDNNGASWNVIDNSIPAIQKYYNWAVPNISTSQALVRIKRNTTTQQAVSGMFVINPQPVLQPGAVQCPGYFAFNWAAVPNANAYEVLQKIGTDLRPIDTVTTTSYILKGLSLDSVYYVAVVPFVSNERGYRSKALTRIPNDGTCTGTISDGDLAVERVVTPQSGRKFTSTELSSNETMDVVIRNLDDVPATNYRVSFKVNGNSWQSQIFTTALAANSSGIVSLAGLNLASTGTYQIKVAIENLATPDPVRTNDTVDVVIKQLVNNPVDITTVFSDDFETAAKLTCMTDEMGILPGDHWDYANSTDSGRFRTFVSSDVLIGGQRSISMDLLYNLPPNQNYLYGTFNLNGFDVATTEARVEFDYKLHGNPKFQSGNDVYIRGNDTAPWIKLFEFDTTLAEGVTTNSTSLSLTNALSLNGQDFSTSFQVRFGQHDTSAIAMNDYGNGLTFDNFKLYNVKNDVQLLSILNPVKFNCGLSQNELVTVRVFNSDNLPQSNIKLFYRYNGGTIVSQTLAALAPKDTVDFTFTQPVNISTSGYHNLDVWLVANGDSYLPNDSILNYRFRNQPVITSYPYLQNFEGGDGDWYTEGVNNSWQYGTPASSRINKAASGTKAWKTNLTGKYNDNETSYLYSPCYDLSGMNNPMLSFSLSTDIENCGDALCDKAYMEYSEDGKAWTKLGKHGSGTNWYSDAAHDVWAEAGNTRWRVASYLLPKMPSLKLRFVLQSDAGASREGIAIDDIHVFDLQYPIHDDEVTYASVAEGANLQDFLSNNKVMAQLFSNGQDLGVTNVTAYFHVNSYSPIFNQYYLPKNFTVHVGQQPTKEVNARFYITDAELLRMIRDNSCTSCGKPEDAYRLGITKYDDPQKDRENGAWLDNEKGVYSFIPYTSIQWVPYEKGYYADIKVNSFSEFWFNMGIPDKKVSGIVLYPNPITDSKLHILWNGKPLDGIEVAIFDAVGKLVYSATATATDTDNITTFDLPQLATGAYIVKYKAGTERGLSKIIVR